MGRPPAYTDEINARIGLELTYGANPPYAGRLLQEDVGSLQWAYYDLKKELETLSTLEPSARARAALLQDVFDAFVFEFQAQPEVLRVVERVRSRYV